MNKIRCIFFSEFHPVTGPKITYQVPEEYITKDLFDSIHTYIITKPELQRKLITVNALGRKILGCPVCIDSAKYERNALIFNLCFVFGAETQTCNYEPVVKKLASYLTQLELESCYLSDEAKKATIPSFLAELLTKLNQTGRCSLFMGESCTIHLKVSPVIDDPPPVQDHDVPVFIRNVANTQWDLTTQQVVPYINGFNHVAKIAAEADVEINLVKACLQNFLHYNLITIISIFQYTNVYTCTPRIKMLAEEPVLQEECLQYVTTKVLHALPSLRDVFMLYSALTPGMTVRDLCARYNPHNLKIDEKKLIQFGLQKGIIRRLQKYPIKLANETGSSDSSDSLQTWLNGCHSYDEICCKTGLSYTEIEDRMDNDPATIFCWK